MRADGRAWLFVPGDRPDRFAKAAASGADHVILDLEDAVNVRKKLDARAAVVEHLKSGASCWVRINAVGTPWHEEDLAALQQLAPVGVVVPKSENPAALGRIAQGLRPDVELVALVESAHGLEAAEALAAHPGIDRLAFGSIDFAMDIGADHVPDALLHARSRLVVSSRAAGIAPPLDGVTTNLDPEVAEADARYGRSLGMGGKLCIHPAQVEPVLTAFLPSAAELDEVRRVVEAADATTYGAVAVDGQLVDQPVLERARRLLADGGS
jgi:citrate lyase subunit beta/citryl-CoA lyase